MTPAIGVSPEPANWTGANFASVTNERTLAALGRTGLLAVTAAVLLTGLGAAVAVLERLRAGRLVATLVTGTLVLPGSTLAVALLISYGRWLGDTLILILLAYLAKFWAFGHRPLSGALDRLPPDELQAARASGAAMVTAVRTVALRRLAPALLTAWLICCVTALHEVTMSSLLYGPGSETFAVVVLNSADLGQVRTPRPWRCWSRWWSLFPRCRRSAAGPAAAGFACRQSVPCRPEPVLRAGRADREVRRHRRWTGCRWLSDPERWSRCWDLRLGKSTLLNAVAGFLAPSAGDDPAGQRLVADTGAAPSRRSAATSGWCSRTTHCGRT